MTSFGHISDSRLAVRVGRGDRRALAALYERYFPSLYDFSAQLLRDQRASAAAVEETFAQAMARLRLGVRPERVRPWLFALARETSLGLTGVDRASTTAQRDGTPGTDDESWPRLLAETAGGPLDRSLLDLHLRRGLEPDELAAALSLEPRTVRGRLARLTETFEQTAAARILVRDARSACPTVNDLLREAGHDEARLSRRRLWRHAQGCGECQRMLRRAGATPDAIAALPLATQPAGLESEVWWRVAERAGEAARHPRGLAPAAAVVVAAGTVAAAIAVVPRLGADSGPVERAAGPASAHVPAAAVSRARIASVQPSAGAAPSQVPRSAAPSGAFLPPTGVRTFSWAPAADAVAYDVTFYRGADVIFSRRTKEARITLPPSWSYAGTVHALEPGSYRWVVWPVLGADGRRADEAIVSSSVVVR